MPQILRVRIWDTPKIEKVVIEGFDRDEEHELKPNSPVPTLPEPEHGSPLLPAET